MTTYSFRAECPADVKQFEEKLKAAGLNFQMRSAPDPGFPDVEIEMEVDASLEALRDLLRHVVDGHVMLQTLQACPLSQNSLERDYNLR